MARLHWFWRGTVAIVVACVFSWLYWDLSEAFLASALRWARSLSPFYDPEGILVSIGVVLPALLLALVVFGVLTRYFGPEDWRGETRCRKCTYILRGITEPRCPECGERI